MELHQSITVESFINGCNEHIHLQADNLMHCVPEEDYLYGLSLVREAIKKYEEEKNIPAKESKAGIPFFRENSRLLIGPEMGMFIVSMNEKPVSDVPLTQTFVQPTLLLSWDYQELADYCLSENIFLLRCKYNEEETIETFKSQLETEYDKFFYYGDYTGFKPDSRLFSLLCNACLEVVQPVRAQEKEWRMMQMKPFTEAEYRFTHNVLYPFTTFSIPKNCLKRITLMDAENNPLLYGSLSTFLKTVGIAPDMYLEGMID